MSNSDWRSLSGVRLVSDPLIGSSGSVQVSLDVADSVSSSPQTVSLSGNGSPADFTIGPASGSSSTSTVTAGGSASYTVTVAPLGAFTQTVALNCPMSALVGVCSVTPKSVSLNGSSAQNVTVRVTTIAPSLAAPRGPTPPATPPMSPWVAFIGLMALALLVWRMSRRTSNGRVRLPGPFNAEARAASRCAFALGIVLFAVMLWVSCGGGGGSTSTPGSGGTPRASYAVTVIATSGSLSHSTNLTLTVK